MKRAGGICAGIGVVLFGIAACESFRGDNATSDPPDGSSSSSSSSSSASSSSSSSGDVDAGVLDAGADADTAPSPSCDRDGAFASVTALAQLNVPPGGSGHASLTSDELDLYYFRANAGATAFELWKAHRATLTAPFDSPTELQANLNTSNPTSPAISTDGLYMLFSVASGGNNNLTLTRRATATAAFGAPILQTKLNSGTNDTNPFLARSGRVYFDTQRNGGAGKPELAEIFTATVAGGADSDYGAPAFVKYGGGPLLGRSPATDGAEERIFFSQKEGTYFVAKLGDLALAAGTWIVTNIRTLEANGVFNGADGNTLVSWVSPDNCRVYFTHGAALPSLYVATRQPR